MESDFDVVKDRQKLTEDFKASMKDTLNAVFFGRKFCDTPLYVGWEKYSEEERKEAILQAYSDAGARLKSREQAND